VNILNSANLTGPLGLVERGGGRRQATFPVRYGLIEAASGPVLVDTGYGPRVLRGARSRALKVYAAVLRPRLLPFTQTTFDTILLTHFHADHVARLRDFPHARLLASQAAIAGIVGTPHRTLLRHGIFPELLPDDLAARLVPVETLPRVATGTCLGDGHDICGDASHIAIALPGHAAGHLGIFWRERTGPVLYATDAAWTHKGLMQDATPALARGIVFDDRAAGATTAAMIRAFAAEGGTVVLCHDPA
jgi:glyoxylase-like metal-dependent hydrolase (beta-lactamase superfamily II)